MRKADVRTACNNYLKSGDAEACNVIQPYRVPFRSSSYAEVLSLSRDMDENKDRLDEETMLTGNGSKYSCDDAFSKSKHGYTYVLDEDDFFLSDCAENCSFDSFSMFYDEDDIGKRNEDADGDQSTVISYTENNAILERNREDFDEEIDVDASKPDSVDLKSTTDSAADDDSAFSEENSIAFQTTRSCLTDYKNSGKRNSFKKCPKVRFADALGLELENIRYLTPPNEVLTPSMISNALSEKFQILYSSHRNRKTLTPLYEQPNTSHNFINKVLENVVLLEYAFSNRLSVFGSVRVKNIEYEKHVFVRYSANEWKTFTDIEATFSHHHADSNTDSFSFYCDFTVWSHGLHRIEFAVFYRNSRRECIWDNNNGKNYALVCKYS